MRMYVLAKELQQYKLFATKKNDWGGAKTIKLSKPINIQCTLFLGICRDMNNSRKSILKAEMTYATVQYMDVRFGIQIGSYCPKLGQI